MGRLTGRPVPAFANLSVFLVIRKPQLGKHRPDIKSDYYCFPEGMHLVFYKILDDGIDIIGVFHRSMDVEG